MNASNLNRSLDFLSSKGLHEINPSFAVITGSGLSQCLNEYTEVIERYSYTDIPSFPIPKVGGHIGELLVVKFNNSNILALVFSGRVHLYEGYNIDDVLFQVRLANLLNIKMIIITCASGSLGKDSMPGELGLITDQIDLQNFAAPNRTRGLNSIYDNEIAASVYKYASNERIPIRRGTLCSVLGPCYETSAEADLARLCGADWMSMSTAKEAAEASALGLDVVGITGVTNLVNDANMSHEYVIKSAANSSKHLWALLSAVARGGYGKRR